MKCEICGHEPNPEDYWDTALSPQGLCEGCQQQVDSDQEHEECSECIEPSGTYKC
jgi:hypothetical protein